jgi:Tol biopolymer transport system component
MSEPSPGTPAPERPLDDRLDSWKEIAAYLNRDVTTAQRWEKREAMPVHRHLHDRMGSVYASRAELDAWMRSRNAEAARQNGKQASPIPAAPLPQPEIPVPRAKKKYFFLMAGAAATLAIGAVLWLPRTEYFWRNPIADARFQIITDFGGVEQAATVSRDGHFVAFLSDRDGQMDVWVTQAGSGQFHDLTRSSAPELVNPSIRALGFSPDGSLATYWTRRQNGSNEGDISIWAVPTLGGTPRPYLEGVAEFDWSHDGSRLAYHTPGAGDPLFVSNGGLASGLRPIFAAPAGLHSHFPSWSPDTAYIYFVQGSLPDKLDIWRISPSGGTPERITSHNARVSHPVLLNRRTLMYLAGDSDGAGPWLYSMDVERRIPQERSDVVMLDLLRR